MIASMRDILDDSEVGADKDVSFNNLLLPLFFGDT